MSFLNVERSPDLILNVSALETSFRGGRYLTFLLWSSPVCGVSSHCLLPPCPCGPCLIFSKMLELSVPAADPAEVCRWQLSKSMLVFGFGFFFFEWGNDGRKDMKYIWHCSRSQVTLGLVSWFSWLLSVWGKYHRTQINATVFKGRMCYRSTPAGVNKCEGVNKK